MVQDPDRKLLITRLQAIHQASRCQQAGANRIMDPESDIGVFESTPKDQGDVETDWLVEAWLLLGFIESNRFNAESGLSGR